MDTKDRNTAILMLSAILLGAFFLRVRYLTADRFHADEALYAGWALRVLDGDPFLLDVPVDKPPLYLLALVGSMRVLGTSEVAARYPNLVASLVGIALLYRLAARLYGRSTGAWAALFLALSPFDILFARTAFTDPMLVAWTLGALCAIVEGHWFASGLCLGLAFATKQHAVVLIPLIIAAGWVTGVIKHAVVNLLSTTIGFALPFALVTWWDSARWAIRPGYWQQSAMSYGGLTWAAFDSWADRFHEWLTWARYLTGSTVVGLSALIGVSILLIVEWRRAPGKRETWLDTTWAAYALAYLLAHTVFQFSIWDRYLLPLAPLVSLLLARVTVRGIASLSSLPPLPLPLRALRASVGKYARILSSLAKPNPQSPIPSLSPPLRVLRASVVKHKRVLCVSVVFLLALLPAWRAAHNGYPIGGEHWAYQGLDHVVAYLRQHAPPDAVLYHHWLRWHYTYYLYDTEFELRWWQSGAHLRQEALRTPDREQYIALPDWRTLEPTTEGIRFEQLYETRRRDDSVSLRLYRVRFEG
jgi:hypothetical protein